MFDLMGSPDEYLNVFMNRIDLEVLTIDRYSIRMMTAPSRLSNRGRLTSESHQINHPKDPVTLRDGDKRVSVGRLRTLRISQKTILSQVFIDVILKNRVVIPEVGTLENGGTLWTVICSYFLMGPNYRLWTSRSMCLPTPPS